MQTELAATDAGQIGILPAGAIDGDAAENAEPERWTAQLSDPNRGYNHAFGPAPIAARLEVVLWLSHRFDIALSKSRNSNS